ncbi:MAG: hypothetical protein IPQ04_04310 [Saprospiraceae bacterium]|nr:hypothetical protein [Saprospiraceae bacterium]
MKKLGIFFKLCIAFGLIGGLVNSCVKKDFDAPPFVDERQDINPTLTIRALKSMHTIGTYKALTSDDIIRGTVVGDDASGNIFKTLHIQDETGGIEVKINAVSLFNFYPAGTTIAIKLKGLYMGDYNGQIQLGGSYEVSGTRININGIEEALYKNYIVRAKTDIPVTPLAISISQLNTGHTSMLVELNNVNFINSDVNVVFADVPGKNSLNRTLEDCDGSQIVMRTSGYSSFGDALTPAGKKKIVAIFTVFGTTKQLVLRDLTDIKAPDGQCVVTLDKVGDIRALFSGSATTLPAGKKMRGIVITDKVGSNITNKNIAIQGDDGKGIIVRFSATNTFDLGDEVEFDLGGAELSEFNGLLQINNLPLSKASKKGTGTITPKEITIGALLADFENHESTLVAIKNVTISSTSGTTFNGTTKLTDASGSIDHYTTSFATFSGSTFPTAQQGKIVGVVGQGGSSQAKQISIRNLSDIQP